MVKSDIDDPHDIIPGSFMESYPSADTVDEALRSAEQAPGSTPHEEKDRCPNCRSYDLMRKRQVTRMPHRRPEPIKCTRCWSHFCEPLSPLADRPVEQGYKWLFEMQAPDPRTGLLPGATPFQWVDRSDLEEPEERGMSSLFQGLDRKVLVELVTRLHNPTNTYAELAELFPYSPAWVGERVREWKRGEHRGLVERSAPTVEPPDDAEI